VTDHELAAVIVPAGTITWIWPVPAPAGAMAVIRVSESTVNVAAGVAPNLTEVAR
jgi:hypothetical protein